MVALAQRSFSGGEISPALYARVDQVKYQTGLKQCRNFFVMRHGGVSNRPGTELVAEVKDSSKTIRFIPFVFNSDQTYVLEFGDQYMRVHRNGVQLKLTAQDITAITNANPCVVTYSGADTYANGDEVYISGITGAIGTYLNGRNFKVVNVNTGANTFELDYMDGDNVNSTAFGAYTSGGTLEEVYTISTPYLEADLSTLQFVQSADVITIVHPSYAPRELARSGHTSWTLTTITFAPGISAPTGVTNSGAAGSTTQWVVTSIASETYEESLASSSTGSSATPSSGSPITVSWNAATGAQEYNVYKNSNGIYGFIGTSGGLTFVDNGITAETSDTPPTARNPFNATGDYPSVVGYVQQRLTFANTDNDTEKCWMSRTGQFKNFTVSSPLQDDDAVTFTIVGRQVNEIRNILELGKPVVLTTGGEGILDGDESGVIKPTAINHRQYSYNGSSQLSPLVVGGNALYLQARGTIVRDLGFDIQVDGYTGNDLTVFSNHLFDGYTIADWAFQQVPHSIAWVVRDDGTLLGLTYVREHQIWAWHRHDFEGDVENVCVVPEGTEDFVYVCVKRTIDGETRRYIERMSTRNYGEIEDAIFLDSCLSYDGWNSGATTMTLTEYSSGGWLYTSTITVTASASTFTSADVGKEVHLIGEDNDGNETILRVEITEYVSATVVRGKPNKTVPTPMRSVPILQWAFAVKTVSGLWHLEGEAVSVFADGFVVASPNNASLVGVTVTTGTVTLERPYAKIHVGLPITSDLETLDIDLINAETLANKKVLINECTAFLESSRGAWFGTVPPTDDETDPLENLVEKKLRSTEGYDDPVALATGNITVKVSAKWVNGGHVFVRQVDPLPLSILAIVPTGYVPVTGG